MKTSNKKIIEVQDWDKLVKETYGKIYSFQQQEGCQSRGIVWLNIPDESCDEEMNDKIPEVINNGDIMGVKFNVWLSRDPKTPLNPTDEELAKCNYYWGKTEENKEQWKNDPSHIHLFWERNFYPELQTIANDLYKKGLIEAGEYGINIDW